MSATFNIRQGDLLPVIEAACVQGNGAALDLTTATGVTFRMWRRASPSTLKVEGVAQVVDGPNGVVRYLWAGTDTDAPGVYNAEFVVTFPGPKPQTLPTVGHITVNVLDAGLPA
jgi:hypothetical protein